MMERTSFSGRDVSNQLTKRGGANFKKRKNLKIVLFHKYKTSKNIICERKIFKEG